METPALWTYRSATSLSHCFAVSDLDSLAWAHNELRERMHLYSGRALQPMVFYLAPNESESAYQIGAIARFMDEIELLS